MRIRRQLVSLLRLQRSFATDWDPQQGAESRARANPLDGQSNPKLSSTSTTLTLGFGRPKSYWSKGQIEDRWIGPHAFDWTALEKSIRQRAAGLAKSFCFSRPGPLRQNPAVIVSAGSDSTLRLS